MRKMSTKTSTKKRKSEEYSPTTLLIDAHYKTSKLNKIWNRNRIQRLLGFLKMTERELVTLLNTTRPAFRAAVNKGSITGPAALILTIIENSYLGEFVDDTIDIFDFNGRSGNTEEYQNNPS